MVVEAIKLQSSQTSSLSSMERIPGDKANLHQRQKHDKKKAISIFNCNMPLIDNLRYGLIDDVYVITSQPATLQRLSIMYALLGHPRSFDEALYTLGCYSFNDFIRRNKHCFTEFLEIYVTKIEVKNAPPQLVLNYYNKRINHEKSVRKAMKEAIETEDTPDPKRFAVSFEETRYFEYHNSPEFIEGRKKFAKAVDRCQRGGLVNRNSYVPVNKLQEVCKEMFHENYTSLMKSWFPKCSGTENVMRKIIFEEISCSFSSQETKKSSEFQLKEGISIDEICQNLDSLKEDILQFHDKVLRDSGVNNPTDRSRSKRPNRYSNHGRKPAKTENNEDGGYGASGDEADKRVENAKFITATHRFKADIVDPVGAGKKAEAKQEAPKIKKYSEFSKKFKLLPDYDLDVFVPMMKDIGIRQDVFEYIQKNESVLEIDEVETGENEDMDEDEMEEQIEVTEMVDKMEEVQVCSDV